MNFIQVSSSSFKFQVHFGINLDTIIKHMHLQIAKLTEAGLCLSELKEKYKSINRNVITIINITYTCTRVT